MATIAILCVGSRGDVQPYVALGDELSSRGHSVTVATHATFRDLAAERGLEFAALPGDPREQVRREETKDLMATGRGLVRFVRRFASLAEPWLEEVFNVLSPICAGADLVVYSPLAFPGWHIAQANGTPSVLAPLQPFTATREFPAVSLGGLDFGALGNRMSHRIVQQVAWLTVRRRRPHPPGEAWACHPSDGGALFRSWSELPRLTCTASPAMWCPNPSIGAVSTTSRDTGS